MKNITLILVVTLIFFSSCNNDKNVGDSFLNSTIETIDEQNGACDGEGACGSIKIEYPIFSNNNKSVDDKLNSDISNTITSFYDTKSIDKTADKFITDFANFINEFPDVASNKWEVSMLYKININTDKLLTLSFSMEGYTGGAHGFRTTSYSNYNPKTGERLQLSDVVNDVEKLTSIAREIFIEENNLDADLPINAQGFWFVNDTFTLNNNFKITPEGISFHFNQYEIASYAQGDFDIDISMDKLERLLK